MVEDVRSAGLRASIACLSSLDPEQCLTQQVQSQNEDGSKKLIYPILYLCFTLLYTNIKGWGMCAALVFHDLPSLHFGEMTLVSPIFDCIVATVQSIRASPRSRYRFKKRAIDCVHSLRCWCCRCATTFKFLTVIPL